MSFDGEKLKQARKDADVSVPEISRILESRGIRAKPNTIYSWESGNSQPSPDALLTMCERYNIFDPLAYFGYLDEMPSDNLSHREKQIALAYRQATEDDRGVVDCALNKYIDVDKKETASAG